VSARLRAIEAAALACRSGASGDGAGHVLVEAAAWWRLDEALCATEPPAAAHSNACYAAREVRDGCTCGVEGRAGPVVGWPLPHFTPNELAALPVGSRFASPRADSADFWKIGEGAWVAGWERGTGDGNRCPTYNIDDPAKWAVPKDAHWVLVRIGWGS